MAKTTVQLPSAYDFLKEAWELLREHAQLLMKLVALVYLPVNTLLYFTASQSEDTTEVLRTISNQARLANLLEFVLGSVVTIGAIYLVGLAKGVKLEPVSTFNELLHQIGNKYQVTLRILFRSGILVTLLSLLLIIPGILYGVYWTFVVPIVVLTSLKGGEALKASTSLVKGRWWTVFGYNVAFGLAGVLIVLVAMVPSLMVPDEVAWFSIVTNLFGDFLALVPVMAGALLYLKLAEIGPVEKVQK